MPAPSASRAAPLCPPGVFGARRRSSQNANEPALAFTETVTLVANNHVPAEAYDEVAAHLTPDEIGALLALIVTINAWNMLAVASRAWEPAADLKGEVS